MEHKAAFPGLMASTSPPLHKELPILAGEERGGKGSQSFACFRGLSLDSLAGPSTESRNFRVWIWDLRKI